MLLKCKDIAHLASDYLDHNTTGTLSLKIRWHLMICANCRRFVRHLKITNVVSSQLANSADEVDAEAVLRRIKERLKQSSP